MTYRRPTTPMNPMPTDRPIVDQPPHRPAGQTRIDKPLKTETAMGRLIVISGPSGAGKSTVVRKLIATCDLPLELSVSATTRPPRPGEIDGRHYHFLTREDFERRQQAGEFIEFKEVFGLGSLYGTLRDEVATGLKSGKWVILEIDVQGALSVFERSDLNPISLFIHPGDMNELERRLRHRGTEDEDKLTARLETAAKEMSYISHYQYEIINNTVDHTVAEICQILKDQQENRNA